MPSSARCGTLVALEAERPRDDADGQRPGLVSHLCDDRRGAGAGAAAHAGGDEDHLGAANGFLEVVARLLGGPHAALGVAAGAEALGQAVADADLHVGLDVHAAPGRPCSRRRVGRRGSSPATCG